MSDPLIDSNESPSISTSTETPRTPPERERGRATRAALVLAAACTCTATASFIPRDQGGFLPLAFLVVVLTAAFLRRSTAPGPRSRRRVA